MDSSPPQLAAA